MPRFDLEQLYSFVAVVDNGSITAATRTLCRSPSAISVQLKNLETTCRAVLLTRTKRGMSLTPAGETLLPLAREILNLNDWTMAQMNGTSLRGRLRVAITDYFMPQSIAPMLKQLNKTFPELKLEVSVMSSSKIIEVLPDSRFDICIYFRFSDEVPFRPDQEIILRTEQVFWVAHQDVIHTSTELLPLLTLPPECKLQSRAITLLERGNVGYHIVHSASSVTGLLSAIQAGLGIGCLNESIITPDMYRLGKALTLPSLPSMQLCLYCGSPDKAGVSELSRVIESLC